MSTDRFPETARTTIGRAPERGNRDRATAAAILDEGRICHVGVCADHGPVVIPTTYARRGDELLIHGSPAATWLRSTGQGTPVCVTVTHVDGLIVARSEFHHSMNYRSVVVFGVAEPITELAEREEALHAIVDHVFPGRRPEVRPMLESEVNKTLVVRVPLEEASVKIRTGGPADEPEDIGLPGIWAGEIPLSTTFGEPIPATDLVDDIPLPASVRALLS